MDISIIVPLYKKIDNLNLILQSLEEQTFKSFEVIIAEDDDADESKQFTENAIKSYFFPIKHISQSDKGFRKNKILNKAIQIAAGDLIVFIDGDCIVHRQFLNQYRENMALNLVLYGRRVMLGKKITLQIMSETEFRQLSMIQLLLSDSNRIEEAVYLPWLPKKNNSKGRLLGCNMGIMKTDLLAINGFDESYVHASIGEDVDIEWRLRLYGAEFRSLKQKAIQYHLYHPIRAMEVDYPINRSILDDKKRIGKYYCDNGINKS